VQSKQDFKVHTPAYDTAVETSWDGVDRSEFDSDQEFRSVHIVEHGDEVHLPVAHKEDGELRLVYEGLNSAHDLASQIDGIPEQTVDNARDILEMLRESEFPDLEPLDADQSSKDISEDEVSECISEKVDEGVPQEQAVAICLSEAESGDAEPENRRVSPGVSRQKEVLDDTILVPDQLLYLERDTAMLVSEMLELDGVHTHELGGTTYYMPGETHEQFFEAVGEAGVEGLIEQNQKAEYDVSDTTVDITPLDSMVNAAEEALDAKQRFSDEIGDCGTGVGEQRARQIINDEVGPDVIDEVASYLTSHEEDVRGTDRPPTDWGEAEWTDGCGHVQYALWGGLSTGTAKEWAQRRANEVAEARGEDIPYPEIRGVNNETYTMSLENPQFEVGDFVRWDFATGSSTGEIFNMETEEGEGFTLGGVERVASEDNGPAYEIQEWDDTEGEDGEFTNRVIKVESELRDASRPDSAPETSPRNRSHKTSGKSVRSNNFTVDTKSVKIQENSEGRTMVDIPINAVSVDRDGDMISEKGQKDMIEQLESGTVPLMPNHGVGDSAAMYGFEDIFGKFVGGELRDGTTMGTVELREGNRMAEEMVDLLEQDMPISFSVGFIPEETEERRGDDGQHRGEVIHGLDLMEVSAVGVPSNPDAVPQAMSEAVAVAKQAAENGADIQKVASAIKGAVKESMPDQDEDEDDEMEMETVLTDRDIERIVSAVRGEFKEVQLREIEERAEGDVSAEDLAGFMAAHFEGMEVEDVLQAVDEDMEYVGSLSLEAAAGLLGQRMDVPGEAVMDLFAEAADMDTDSVHGDDEDEEEMAMDDDEDDDEMEMSRTADKNQSDTNKISEVSDQKQSSEDEDAFDSERIADKGEFWGNV